MANPRVAVLFTGGTISMRADTGAGGNVPMLGGAALLASVGGLPAGVEVEPIDWGLVPASHLSMDQVLDIGRVLAEVLARDDVDGAVVVQGTDVIEETAYAWDLLPLPAKPLVVVGAMRSASDEAADGPANLRDAIAAAADAALATQGVLVGMAGELHAADDVRKTHTHALDTFRSPNLGRVGTVSGGRVTIERARAVVRLPRSPERAAGPVPLLTYALDAGERPLEAVADPAPAALVVAAAGGGNTPPAYLELARRLMALGVPVALATRCPSGAPRAGYAFDGGSTQWWDSGALFTGTLGPFKSRILLALGLGAGLALRELVAMCEPYGGGARA